MLGRRYTTEFKDDAIKQITERDYGVVEVAKYADVKFVFRPLDASNEQRH
jgi:transposase-like protein